MTELLLLAVGGLIGYFARGVIDEHFSRRREGRSQRVSDERYLRDELLVFVGELRAHADWLSSVPSPETAGGKPSPDEKARLIGEWAYRNAPRMSERHRRSAYLIANVSYMLAKGDRHFLDRNPRGWEELIAAWDDLQAYAEELTRRIHDPN